MAEETLTEALANLNDDNIKSAAVPEHKRPDIEDPQEESTFIDLSDDDVVRRQAIFTYEGQYYLYSYVRDASMELDETMTFCCDADGDHDARELFSAHGYIHSTDAMNNTVAHLESMETAYE